jgi:hypothetical protein
MLVLPQALLALAGLAAVLLAGRSRGDIAIQVLGLALAGFFIGALVQSKGWGYHWIPSSIISVLVLAVLLLRYLRVNARLAIGVLTALLILLTTLTARSVASRYAELELRPYRLPFLMELVEREAEGGTLAILSTDMQAAFPLVNHTGVRWGLRFPCLWPLALFYEPEKPGPFAYHTPPTMSDAERYMFESVLEDLSKNRPTLLIIDTAPPAYVLYGFNYLEYFGQDQRFGELLQSYRELRPLGLFRVFKRVG